jgi:integrase
MTHPLVEQLRSARSEWRRALRGIPEADGLPEIAMEAAFALAFIGLREGEALGLAWQDVDLDAATASICYELKGSGEMATRHQLKTEASEATVPPATLRGGAPAGSPGTPACRAA